MFSIYLLSQISLYVLLIVSHNFLIAPVNLICLLLFLLFLFFFLFAFLNVFLFIYLIWNGFLLICFLLLFFIFFLFNFDWITKLLAFVYCLRYLSLHLEVSNYDLINFQLAQIFRYFFF